ncbi:MAG: hypothetical protein SPG61_06605 [Arcanobacterium sp.]|nr:hypothetical protein [Arcanobacterium sp.]
MSNLDNIANQPEEIFSQLEETGLPAELSETEDPTAEGGSAAFLKSSSEDSALNQSKSQAKVSAHAFDSPVTRTIITFSSLMLALIFALTLSLNAGVWVGALLAGLLLALGMPRLMDLPHPNSTSVFSLIVLLAALFPLLTGNLEYLSIIAVLTIPVVFILEMARKGTALRRLEQVSGSFVTVSLVLCAITIGFVPNFEFGTRYGFITVLVTAVVALLHAFQTRSMLLASLLNGLVSGAAIAIIVSSLPIWLGLLLGVLVAIIFWVLRQACFSRLSQTGYLELFAYAALPFAIIGPLTLCFTLLAG